MAHTLAKQIVNEDGYDVDIKEQCWHLLTIMSGDKAMLCTGEFVDEGCKSDASQYEFKTVKRGAITCKVCMDKIKEFKGIKL